MRRVLALLTVLCAVQACHTGGPPALPPAALAPTPLSEPCALERTRMNLAAPRFGLGEEWVCTEACARGDEDGCVGAGVMYEEGQNVPRDLGRAVSLYRASCERGYLPACSHFAALLWRGLGELPDVTRAVELAERACDRGDGYGCTVLGHVQAANGLGAAAGTSFELACDLGDVAGCTALAGLWLEVAVDLGARGLSEQAELAPLTAAAGGNEVRARSAGQGARGNAPATSRSAKLMRAAQALGRARELGQQICDKGYGPACALAANAVLHDDPLAALALFERACEGGVPAACVHAADLLASGAATQPTTAIHALDLRDHACAPNALAACDAFVAQGEPALARLRERCDERRAFSCYVLARAARAGQPGIDSWSDLMHRACVLGQADGCAELGAARADGTDGVARDAREARSLFEDGCAGSSAEACKRLGALREAGAAGLSRDLAGARDLYRRACVEGHADACVDFARLLRGRRALSAGLDAPPGGGAQGDGPDAADEGGARALAALLDERACAAGVARGCTALGELRLRSADARERARAAQLLHDTCFAPGTDGVAAQACAEGCEPDRARACSLLAWANAEGVGVPPNLVGAAGLAQQSCGAGDMLGCAVLGYLHLTGRGARRDEARGIELFGAACDAKVGIACANLALCHLEGIGTEVDPARAFELNERACSLGVLKGCTALAWQLGAGVGVAKDEGASVAHLRAACDGGYGPACTELARAHEAGRFVERSPERALALYAEACGFGELDGCYRRALALDRTKAPRDAGQVAQLYALACDGGQALGCTRLGEMLETGDGLPVDVLAAVERYEQALRGGDARAIDRLLRLQRGHYVAPRRFESDLHDACARDHAPSCRTLANLYWAGQLLARDDARAGDYAKKACELHDAAGCTALGRMQLAGTRAVRRNRVAALETLGRACPDVRAGYVVNEVLSVSAELWEPDLAGCHALALALGPRDAARRRALLEAACTQGHGGSCFDLARDLGKSPDALALRMHACDLGEVRACIALAEEARPTDARRAMELYTRACREDAAEACEALVALREAEPALAPPEAAEVLDGACARGVTRACNPGR